MERRVARSMTYREKLLQADREAKAAVVGLVLTIVVWLVCGIGLSGPVRMDDVRLADALRLRKVA